MMSSAAARRVSSPGTVFAGYTIVRLLGSGGMGEVFKAFDDRLRRDVAIKRIRPGKEDTRPPGELSCTSLHSAIHLPSCGVSVSRMRAPRGQTRARGLLFHASTLAVNATASIIFSLFVRHGVIIPCIISVPRRPTIPSLIHAPAARPAASTSPPADMIRHAPGFEQMHSRPLRT